MTIQEMNEKYLEYREFDEEYIREIYKKADEFLNTIDEDIINDFLGVKEGSEIEMIGDSKFPIKCFLDDDVIVTLYRDMEDDKEFRVKRFPWFSFFYRVTIDFKSSSFIMEFDSKGYTLIGELEKEKDRFLGYFSKWWDDFKMYAPKFFNGNIKISEYTCSIPLEEFYKNSLQDSFKK